MRFAAWLAAALMLVAAVCPAKTIVFDENRGQAGIAVPSLSQSQVEVSFKLDQVSLDDFDVDGTVMQQVSIPGIFLPNDEGAPNLPGLGRFIAIPQGAEAVLEILGSETEVIQNVDVVPAFAIPREDDDSPLVYRKNPAIYSRDAFYPEKPVKLSEPTSIRGVDAVVLGITPFQYNPVKRELLVYKSIDVRVTFLGGTGQFGENRLRNRYWEPILAQTLLNYSTLPEVDFKPASTRDNEYEYVIVVPDDPTYKAWADSIAHFRKLQGIDAGVVTLTQTGATTTSIEAWINNAYDNWSTPPAAILLLADYVASGGTTGITSPVWNSYCVSDNIYGDVDGNDLPDIVMARMTANTSNIARLVGKALSYERHPPTNPSFYQRPLVACGWQDERWFTICTEIVYGFLANELGKTPVREYAIYSGTPGTAWSTNPNTYMLVNYFGPSGLGYIPATPQHLTDWGGNATRINNDINAGTFIVQHRDHGEEIGWGEPRYISSNLTGLTNNDLPFVFSINCLTGEFNWSSECFAEAFHRMNHGALGLIAATEVSYSFVNDAFVFGIYDEMWPSFDPGYGRTTGPADLRPAFGNASGKYYLAASSWPYNPGDKTVTYHLFHMHGDAFTTLYSEVPQALTVSHQGVLPIGATTFQVTADAGSMIALTINGEIIGVAEGTGAPVDVPVIPAAVPGTMKLTVTKTDRYRHSEDVPVIYPVTYEIDPPTVPINETTDVTVTIWDSESNPLPNVLLSIDGWGIAPAGDTTDALGEAHFTLTPPYGEDLTVVGREIGQSYDCVNTVLPVTGGVAYESADIVASVPDIGLNGSLTPYYEGEITGTASEEDFTLLAVGCGVDASAVATGASTVDLLVTPTATGTIHSAIAKQGFDTYLEDILVQVVYGQMAGEVYEEGDGPIVGAKVKGYPAGADTTGVEPLFAATTGTGGAYTIEGDLEVGYYDVYVSMFGYLTGHTKVFIAYGPNDEDFYLETAPSGVVSGTVTEVTTGRPLSATIKVYRADNMQLYAQTTSDSLAGGAYSVELPYFNYTMNVRAYHHIPVNQGIVVDAPTKTVSFELERTLANILVISDGVALEQEAFKVDKTGAVLATYEGSDDTTDSAAQIATDLVALGYDVTQETAAASNPATWLNYDFIISASGDNTNPVASATYRAGLESYVAAGGKLIVEGGEVGYDSISYPGYPTFAANVLHIASWQHDSSGNVRAYDLAHPVTTTPNTIGTITLTYANYGDEDSNTPLANAHMVCDWSTYPGLSSVIVYDDNPAPQSGQMVFFEFDYLAAGAGRADLLENAVAYLMAQETPPTGSIAGRACLEGQSDHSGIKVTASPSGKFAYTATDGTYAIGDMYGGTYTLTATKSGWSVGLKTGVVVHDNQQTGGVDFYLYPVQEAQLCNNPALAIPDNTPAGVYNTMTFPQDVTIADVEIYVNITHTYIGDLIVEVRSPQGTTVRLHNRSGGSADNIVGWYDSQLAVNGPGALTDFIGQHSNGDWRIWVSDNAGVDIGTLNTWCVKVVGGSSTGVPETGDHPASYVLRGVTPNPFNPVTKVSYGMPETGHVTIAVYSVSGQLVRMLVDGESEAGYHSVMWDGRDEGGAPVASGVYFCRMNALGFHDAAKMVLLK